MTSQIDMDTLSSMGAGVVEMPQILGEASSPAIVMYVQAESHPSAWRTPR